MLTRMWVLTERCIAVYISTMKRTNIYLSDAQLKQLRESSAKTGAPVAELVRRAIDAYLRKQAK